MIEPGVILTLEPDGDAIEFVNGEPVKIRVMPLFTPVERAWKALDKTALIARKSREPKARLIFQHSNTEVPAASSGCNVIPKALEL